MARKTAAEAERTRQRIIEAAAEVFASQGVPDTTLEQIARRAGVTRGAVYWHFKDKQDLLRNVLSSIEHPLELAFSVETDLDHAWELMIAAMVDAVSLRSSRQLSEILIFHGLDDTGEIHHRLMKAREHFTRYLDLVLDCAIKRGELPACLDKHTVVEMFKGLTTGLLYEGLKNNEHECHVIRATLQSFLVLLRAPPLPLLNRPWFPRHSPSSGNSVSHTLLETAA